eukprot:343243-Pelagomonas_calceolata.AAC.2
MPGSLVQKRCRGFKRKCVLGAGGTECAFLVHRGSVSGAEEVRPWCGGGCRCACFCILAWAVLKVLASLCMDPGMFASSVAASRASMMCCLGVPWDIPLPPSLCQQFQIMLGRPPQQDTKLLTCLSYCGLRPWHEIDIEPELQPKHAAVEMYFESGLR